MDTLQLLSFIFLWIFIFGEGILIFLLYRHIGIVYSPKVKNQSKLETGKPAPRIIAFDQNNQQRTLPSILSGSLNFLIFGTTNCPACRMLLSDSSFPKFLSSINIPCFFVYDLEHGDGKTLKEKNLNIPLEFLIVNQAVFADFDIKVTPYAFIMSQDTVIISHSPVSGVKDLENLFTNAIKAHKELENIEHFQAT